MISGFHGPPSAVERRLLEFNGGWSLVTKSLVKNLACPEAELQVLRYWTENTSFDFRQGP